MTSPSHVGPHAIVRELGRGGMGCVYLATHARLGIPVAVKVSFERDPELVARFRREAEVLASLRHPNVVEAYEAGLTPSGEPYLVLEYVEGSDLAARVRTQGPLDPSEAAAIGVQVARGVAAAHARGVTHRDLKPENVLLGHGGPKVTDFGLARLRDARHSLTASGVVLGTPAYMPPEQLMDAREVDARSDVYAIGGILYFLVSGHPPVAGKTAIEVMSRACQGQREPWPEGIPADYREVAECALAEAPGDRYSSVELLAAALEELAVLGGAPPVGASRAGLILGALLALGLGVIAAGLALTPAAGPPPAGSSSPTVSPADASPAPSDAGPALSPADASPAPSDAGPALSPVDAGPSPSPSALATAKVATGLGWAEEERRRRELLRGPRADLRRAAEAGEALAQGLLGRLIWLGVDAKPDRTAGLTWLRRGAEGGSPTAQADFGGLLLALERPTEGRAWLERAYAAGELRGHYVLAARGELRDLAPFRARALARWESGDAEAGFYLAKAAFMEGNQALATDWLGRAAERGSRLARAHHAVAARESEALEERKQAQEWLREGIELGEPAAFYGLGRTLLEGEPRLGVLVDRERARHCLEVAARGDIQGARTALASISSARDAAELLYEDYRRGYEPALEHFLAVVLSRPETLPEQVGAGVLGRLLERALASEEASVTFLVDVGIALQRGHPRLPADPARAVRIFERAAARGDPRARQALGHAYLFGKGVARDVPKGRALLERLADEGSRGAHFLLGQALSAGLPPGERDLGAARRHLAAAFAAGEERALGPYVRLCEETGEELERARELLRSTGELSPDAKAVYARWVLEGRGAEPDPEQAKALFLEAVAGGADWAAHYGLAKGYRDGLFGARDLARARRHYELAARKGAALPTFRLAEFLLEHGEPGDVRAALELLRRSGERGIATGYGLLAKIHAEGLHGQPKDPALAARNRELEAKVLAKDGGMQVGD